MGIRKYQKRPAKAMQCRILRILSMLSILRVTHLSSLGYLTIQVAQSVLNSAVCFNNVWKSLVVRIAPGRILLKLPYFANRAGANRVRILLKPQPQSNPPWQNVATSSASKRISMFCFLFFALLPLHEWMLINLPSYWCTHESTSRLSSTSWQVDSFRSL